MLVFANIGSIFKLRLFKRGLLITIVFGLFFCFPLQVLGQSESQKWTIVIDPGHGGKDPGCLGYYHSREKNVTLAVALKFGQFIREHMKNVRVIFTRTTDVFIPLYRRAEIANKNHANLFVSIHCNSNPDHVPHGTETYVMGLGKTKENMEVAEAENKAIKYEKNSKAQYDGFKLNSPQSYIKLSLFQNAYLKQSLQFAHDVEQEMHANAGMKARGVDQAGFLVLWRTTMPSVLVELGFLSNKKNAAFLLSKKGQTDLAYGLYMAFRKYTEHFEKENAIKSVMPKALSQTKKADPASKNISGLEFRVQFISSGRKFKNPEKKFPHVNAIGYYYQHGIYRYTSGHFADIQQANNLQNILREKGYKGAFVVAFYKGKRISTAKAKEMIASSHKK